MMTSVEKLSSWLRTLSRALDSHFSELNVVIATLTMMVEAVPESCWSPKLSQFAMVPSRLTKSQCHLLGIHHNSEVPEAGSSNASN
jgi:hypothetical protein